jgi:hypothetical protein
VYKKEIYLFVNPGQDFFIEVWSVVVFSFEAISFMRSNIDRGARQPLLPAR